MRTIAILTLLAALIGVAIAEQICIAKTYNHMKSETAEIVAIVQAYDAPKETLKFDEYLKIRADELHKYWLKRERQLGVIIRHIDLSYISDALIYAQNFIHADNKEEALAGLRRLEYLLDSYSKIYGLNGVNIL